MRCQGNLQPQRFKHRKYWTIEFGQGGVMAMIFQVQPVDDGFLQFNLVDGQGELFLIGGEYETRDQVEGAIKDVRVGSLMSQQISKGQTPSGHRFFVIKNTDGQVIAKSTLFESEMNFDNALHHVKDNACVAEITYS